MKYLPRIAIIVVDIFFLSEREDTFDVQKLP